MLFDPGIPLTAVLLFWGVVWTMYGIRDPRWGHWLGSALALMGTMVSVSVASTAAFLSMGYGRVARAESRALKAAELALMDQSYGPLWITGLLCVLFAALVWIRRPRPAPATETRLLSVFGVLATCGPAAVSGLLLVAFHLGFMRVEPSAITLATGLLAKRLLAVAIVCGWLGFIGGGVFGLLLWLRTLRWRARSGSTVSTDGADVAG